MLGRICLVTLAVSGLTSTALGATKVTRRVASSAPRIAASTDAAAAVKAYALVGEYERLPGKTCSEMFDLFFAKSLSDFPTEMGDYAGGASCSADDEDGPATAFDYLIELEPTPEGVAAVQKFLADHQGLDVDGEILDYRAVWGFLNVGTVTFYFASGDGLSEEASYEVDVTRILANGAEVKKWATKAKMAIENPDGETFLQWYDRERTTGERTEILRRYVMPDSTKVTGSWAQTLILEDRSVTRSINGYAPAERDCTQSATGKCL